MDKVMQTYMKINSSKCDAWIQYLNFELAFGNINNARSVLKRAVNLVKDDIQEICLEYVEFERRFGEIEEMEKAEEIMIQKISQLITQEDEIKEEGEQVKENEEKVVPKEKKKKKKKNQKEEKQNKNLFIEEKKQKKQQKIKEQQKEEQEEKDMEIEEQQQRRQIYYDSENTIFIKNLPKHLIEENIVNLFDNKDKIVQCRLIKDKTNNQSRGIAYIDFINGQEAQLACKLLNNKNIEGQFISVNLSKPPSHDTQLDERTLFLNDLPFTITEEILRKEFKEVDKFIEEIRIIINKATGKPKGFAYMQLKSKEAAQKALEKYSKLIISNRKIIVLLANSQKIVNNTILLKNLAFAVNESDIIEFFKERGLEVTNALVVRNSEGKSKGNGFAEFKDYNQFMKALDLKKGELLGRMFEIIKSKSQITQKKLTEKKIPALSNEQAAQFILNYDQQDKEKKVRRKDESRRREVKNVISLNQKNAEEIKDDYIVEDKVEKKVKTNDDFRSLIFGKK